MKLKNKIILAKSWIELILRYILGITFVYASFHKIIAPAEFAKIIYGYNLFPDWSINFLAITVPFFELFSGIAIIVGVYPRSAAAIINLMLFAFIVAISINLMRGQEFDCGCFSYGDDGHSSSAAQLLIRDIILFSFGSYVIFFQQKRKYCILNDNAFRN
ncbi:MAG: DoxX family membrane protein [Desulfobacterales bacterium]|nr:DoxX family membrane protein [Desulfobacterales bacterium]